jgi:thiol-disulfide isomerase/thioredoxin
MIRLRTALLCALLALAPLSGRAEAASLGQPAPALAATELNGQPFDLAAQRGRVVIVNFWATWCGPCRTEMPALDAFYRSFRDRGLVVIGISVDRWSDRGKVAAMMRAFSYPAAMVNEARVDDFPRPTYIPVSYIIDRAGLLHAIRNSMNPGSLAATVLPLLRQPARPPANMAAAR